MKERVTKSGDMERRSSHIELADKIARIEVAIAKGFAEGSSFQKDVERNVADLRKDMEQVIHCLYGNGKEGMITKMAKMNQKLSIMWMGMLAAGGLMTAALAYLVRDLVMRIPT